MKNLIYIICVSLIAHALVSRAQTTNELSINPAIVMEFITESNKAYIIEQSSDLITWTNTSPDWLIGGHGDTNTFFSKATSSSQCFRYRSSERPTILESSPTSGSENIDPNTTEITISFPIDMKLGGTWGSAISYGETPSWGDVQWFDSRTLIRSFTLETNTQYAFWLNPPTSVNQNFKTSDGVPLMPTLITFKTQSDDHSSVVNTNIIGIFQSENYPSADSGKWHFFGDNTFVSDFIESTHSMSCGTYSYSSNQLTLVFVESTNPNLMGETEIHSNVIVSNNLYFSGASMSFIRKHESSTTEVVCDWYGTLLGNGQSTDPGAESDVAGFFLLEENTSLILGLEYYGSYPGHYVFSSESISGQGTSFDNTRTMTFVGSVSNNTMTGVFMKSDGPGGTFEVTKNAE